MREVQRVLNPQTGKSTMGAHPTKNKHLTSNIKT